MSSGQFLCLSLLFFLEGPHHPIITSAEATHRPFPSLSGFQPPEVDGSPVDFPCSVLPGSTAEPPLVTADQPDHAQVTTPAAPITMDQQQDNAQRVTAAPTTPAHVQPTPRKTTTESTTAAAPIRRRQPAAEAAPPITNYLYYLLANRNNGGGVPPAGGSSSESDEPYYRRSAQLGRAWNQRHRQQPRYYYPPSYYQPSYRSRYYPSYYRPYRYPSHPRRQTVQASLSSSSSEEFGR